jgi:hypothetical protein
MKIFGLYIYTRKGLDKFFISAFDNGYNRGKETQTKITRAAIHPAVHDLESLRADTWNQDKITKIQNWLESCYNGY